MCQNTGTGSPLFPAVSGSLRQSITACIGDGLVTLAGREWASRHLPVPRPHTVAGQSIGTVIRHIPAQTPEYGTDHVEITRSRSYGHISVTATSMQVDTHVHHSACMHQKHLLRFIKSKLRKRPHEVVIFRDGKYLTLLEVFQSLKLTGCALLPGVFGLILRVLVLSLLQHPVGPCSPSGFKQALQVLEAVQADDAVSSAVLLLLPSAWVQTGELLALS